MPLCHAALHHSLGSVDLRSRLALGLAEHGKQDDPAARGDVIGNPHPLPFQTEAQLAKLAAELPGVRLTEQRAAFLEQVDVELCSAEVLFVQAEQPLVYLRLSFDFAPSDTRYDMPPPECVKQQKARGDYASPRLLSTARLLTA